MFWVMDANLLNDKLDIAPPEDKSRILNSHFFVVLVFVYFQGVVIRIKTHLEVVRTTHMVSQGWGLG